MRLTIGRWVAERELAEGSIVPRGWGYCRPTLYRQDYCYIAPIPLNFILGFGHWFYWRILVRGFGFKGGGFESLRHYWIMEGERRGYTQGYEAGVRHTKIAFSNSRKACGGIAKEERSIKYIGLGKVVQDFVEGRPAADVDRPRRIVGRSHIVTHTDDPCGTSRRVGPDSPCDSETFTGEVSEGLQAGGSELRSDTLDHDSRTDADTIYGRGTEGIASGNGPLVGDGLTGTSPHGAQHDGEHHKS